MFRACATRLVEDVVSLRGKRAGVEDSALRRAPEMWDLLEGAS
jgi:hypothetical protein